MTRKPYSETALTMMARECRAVEPDHFFFAPLAPANLRGLVLRRLDNRTRKVSREQASNAAEWNYLNPEGPHCPAWRATYINPRSARVPAHDDPVWRRVAKRLA